MESRAPAPLVIWCPALTEQSLWGPHVTGNRAGPPEHRWTPTPGSLIYKTTVMFAGIPSPGFLSPSKPFFPKSQSEGFKANFHF